MVEWWAKLQGLEQELELLKEHLAQSEPPVIQEGSRFYCKLGIFLDDIDSSILRDHLNKLIATLNGMGKLFFRDFTGVASDSVFKFEQDGTKTGVGFLTLRKRSNTLTLPPLPDGTLKNWVRVVKNNDLVERALSLYGTLEHDWRSLYMIIEVIEDGFGGEQALLKNNWVPDEKIKLFKRTANSFRILGKEARHASTKHEPPSSPMALSEAQALIKNILYEWVESESQMK